MKSNTLSIQINKPVNEVYIFTITPPNSAKWIPGVIDERTNEWPIRVGTIYTLTNSDGSKSTVNVFAIKENEYIEWISKDKSYHCRYEYEETNNRSCRLNYKEWVNDGKIANPFTQNILNILKLNIEGSNG